MSVISASIVESLASGALGLLSIGMMRHQVGHLLGEPSDTATLGEKSIQTIWKYGNVEFHFNQNVLTLIHADADHLFFGGRSLRIDSGRFYRGMSYEDIEQLLDKIGITNSVVVAIESPQIEISFNSGFRLGVVRDGDAGMGDSGLASWSIRNSECKSY